MDFDKISQADFFHFGYPPIMRHMYENGGEELVEIFRRVKECGLTTSLDMAAVDPDTAAGQADWEEILKKVLPFVDYFVPSVEELCFMADRARYEKWLERAEGRDVTGVLTVEEDAPEVMVREGAAGSPPVEGGAPGEGGVRAACPHENRSQHRVAAKRAKPTAMPMAMRAFVSFVMPLSPVPAMQEMGVEGCAARRSDQQDHAHCDGCVDTYLALLDGRTAAVATP